MRSMRATPTGGRPLPALGYTGSIRAQSSRHGTTRSISARNCARRVVLVYFSKPVPARVTCERVIGTSRSRVMLLVASQHSTRESERLFQRFLIEFCINNARIQEDLRHHDSCDLLGLQSNWRSAVGTQCSCWSQVEACRSLPGRSG